MSLPCLQIVIGLDGRQCQYIHIDYNQANTNFLLTDPSYPENASFFLNPDECKTVAEFEINMRLLLILQCCMKFKGCYFP